jgi:lysophospholipase L1-like esterase
MSRYAEGMRAAPSRKAWLSIIGVAIVTALFCFAEPFAGAPAAKKKKRATVAVTAAQRAAALKKVEANLEASANTALRQPGGLAPVFEQLMRLSGGQSRDPVHILHFGDSHTAADEWTGALRDMFRQRFGDGGSGFSVAGHPFLGYRRFDAKSSASPGWTSAGLRTARGDGFFGLGGISVETTRMGQFVTLDANCDRVEIDYLQQPNGGRLGLYDGDAPVEQFSTEGELAPGFANIETPAGPHHFVLRTLDPKPVRLFGWVADRDAGITYEALGINGAEAAVMLKWNQEMLATYLQRRNPGLIVLAYGTNEATDPSWDQPSYQAMYSSLLEKLRAAAPAASILAIGPGDRWVSGAPRARGVWKLATGIDWVIAAERAACKANGCAYWDTRARMGGAGSMREWVTSGLAQADHVHFTSAGYHRLATALFDDLMRQYATYEKTRTEPDK